MSGVKHTPWEDVETESSVDSAANALRVRRASDAFDAAIARARGEQDGGGHV